MTTDNPTTIWQDWLVLADHLLSFDMWENLDKTLKSIQMTFEDMSSLQTSSVIIAYLNSMFLACVKEPEADQALQTIRDHMVAVQPEILKRKVKASARKAYTSYVKDLAPILATGGELFHAAFTAYTQNDYDPQRDPNLLIREAFQMLDEGVEDKALYAIGQALVIVMRGGSVWNGWHTEGYELGARWFTLVALVQQTFPLIPLGSLAEERLRVDERLATLQADVSEESPEQELADVLKLAETMPAGEEEEVSGEEFMQQWTALISRRDPLTDAEIEAMGDQYEEYVDQAIEILSVIATRQEWSEAEIQNIMFFAHGLGVLRYHEDATAASMLVDILPIVSDSPETLDEITWALEQMGSVSIQALMETVRYTLDSDKLDIATEMLARVGRGDEEVYRFLVERYQEIHDVEEQLIFINALGLLHDQRVVPLLVKALRDLAPDEENVAAVLDALAEMGAPMNVDADAGSVTIDGFGEIKDIVPDWWTPESADDVYTDEGDVELEDEDDSIDLDGLFPDDDDDDKLYIDDDEESPIPPVNAAGFGPVHVEHIGRNDPCPCGSGKKYKHCHGKNV